MTNPTPARIAFYMVLAMIFTFCCLVLLCGCQSTTTTVNIHLMPAGGSGAMISPEPPQIQDGVAESAKVTTGRALTKPASALANSATPAHERSGEAKPFRAGFGAAAPITITIDSTIGRTVSTPVKLDAKGLPL